MMKKQRQNAQNTRKKPPAQGKQRALVLYKTPKSQGPSPLATYRACLTNPFSPMAQGARVPDMYCVPTATRHITRKFTLATNASGEADVCILPSAYIHAFSPRGSVVGGSSLTTLDGVTLTNATVTTSASSLSAQLTNYRIVGYGVKVIGIASMTTNAGSATLATVPAEGYLNTTDTVGNQASNAANAFHTMARWLTSLGIPNASSVVSVASLPALLNSVETSLVNVSERPITVIPKICSPSAFKFRQSADQGPGFNITGQTSVATVSAGNASFLEVNGQETTVIAITGCPASTSMLDIEVVYHIEGIPFISATAGQIIGSDSSVVVCDPVGWMNVIKDVASSPTFRSFVEGVGNSFFPGLGTAVGRLL